MPVLIANNSFYANGAYYDTAGIYIRAYTSSGVDLNNVGFTSETDVQCGGYLIKQNYFLKNYGCPSYGGSSLKFDCLDSSTSSVDHSINNDDITY